RQCGEQVATERAQQKCDHCSSGIRSTWHYCKQCGTTLKEHDGDTRAGFKTIAGMSALPPEALEDAPFSNLRSGELPPMEDVIRCEQESGGEVAPRAPRRPRRRRTGAH